jgi:RNA polymerase sigma-70 factor (ECF subfamily)
MRRRAHEQGGNDYFATTRWTMVIAAGHRTPKAELALAQLCQTYWTPLYAFLRKKGHQPAEAEDIVQAFLTRLIEKTALATADPNRGRFRSFLISSLANFVANERDRERAHKRGGKIRKFSLDFNTAEDAYRREPFTDLTPEKLFDRRWALDLLKLALTQLERAYADADKKPLFERLSPYLTGDCDADTYAAAARDLNISVKAAKMAASRLRKRYREVLRQTIADTVCSPEDIDDEIRHLFAAVST